MSVLDRARARALATVVLRPALKAAGLLAYLLIRALEPWRRVRVGYLVNERIGHQALNTELFLRSRSLDEAGGFLDLFVSGPPTNEQLQIMTRRRVVVLRLPLLGMLHYYGLLPWIAGSRFEADLNLRYGDFERARRAPPQLSFLRDEEHRGRALLESAGVPAGAPFVCFHSRSASYLVPRRVPGEDWTSHDFRDCGIGTFLPAAERLAEKGLYALRMGSVVDEKLKSTHPRIIDYAALHRSDFGDVYLPARCKFFIGNTAGLVCVPWIFDVPVLITNTVPLFHPRAYGPKDLVLPKLLWDAKRGRLLTFREMLASSFWANTWEFAKAGLEVRDNTAEDILRASLEMDARLDGTWTPDVEDAELERRFRALVPSDPAKRGCPPRLSADFLRRHRALLD